MCDRDHDLKRRHFAHTCIPSYMVFCLFSRNRNAIFSGRLRTFLLAAPQILLGFL
jgi:hypothetical protein